MIVGLMNLVAVEINELPKDLRPSWEIYVIDQYEFSAVLRQQINSHLDWHFSGVLKQVSASKNRFIIKLNFIGFLLIIATTTKKADEKAKAIVYLCVLTGRQELKKNKSNILNLTNNFDLGEVHLYTHHFIPNPLTITSFKKLAGQNRFVTLEWKTDEWIKKV